MHAKKLIRIGRVAFCQRTAAHCKSRSPTERGAWREQSQRGLRCNGGANAENSDGDGYVAVVVVVVAKGRHHCCGWVSLNRKKGAGCLGRVRERVVVCEGEVGRGLVVVG